MRHGQSIWNKENRFTGWTDVDLTEQGVEEAREAGRVLTRDGFGFDIAYTSVLKRAIRTLWLVIDEMDLMWIPVERDWRLNERHYGALQGLNKAETVEEHGMDQVQIWRRSYSIQPPPLTADDETLPRTRPRAIERSNRHCSRSRSASKTRWTGSCRIGPTRSRQTIRSGKRVLIAAHGNSLRALVKYLDKVPDDEIVSLNIPTGIPLVYELDDDLAPIRHYYLGDAEKIAKATNAVASQLEKK